MDKLLVVLAMGLTVAGGSLMTTACGDDSGDGDSDMDMDSDMDTDTDTEMAPTCDEFCTDFFATCVDIEPDAFTDEADCAMQCGEWPTAELECRAEHLANAPAVPDEHCPEVVATDCMPE